jgi:hypothetical protein
MREAGAVLLFADEDQHAKATPDPVAPLAIGGRSRARRKRAGSPRHILINIPLEIQTGIIFIAGRGPVFTPDWSFEIIPHARYPNTVNVARNAAPSMESKFLNPKVCVSKNRLEHTSPSRLIKIR